MPMNLVELTLETCRVVREFDELKHELKIEREAHAVTKAELAAVKESLATADLDRDRWKAVHDREWDVEVYPSGDCSSFDSKNKSGKWGIVDSGPTLESALDAAFARFPLESK